MFFGSDFEKSFLNNRFDDLENSIHDIDMVPSYEIGSNDLP